MMRRFTTLVLLALVSTSCSLLTAPTEVVPRRHWLLTSTESPDSSKALVETSIGIGPFRFPSYLESPNLVRRTEPNEIAFWSRNRWAEPLQEGFLRILGENVARDVGTNRIVLFPWYNLNLDYQVRGEVLRFEVNNHGEVTLDCGWSVYRTADKKFLTTQHFRMSRSTDRADPEAVAATMSQLLGKLATEISRAVKAAEQEPAG